MSYISAPLRLSNIAPPSDYEAPSNVDYTPTRVYPYVLTWILLLPLLYLGVYGQFSFLSNSNSALMTENGDLLQTQQAIRPQVVLYYALMAAFILAGHQEIWRVVVRNKLLLLAPLLATLSATWSASPAMTLRGAFELILTTLFAFYLSERFTTEHLMKLLMFSGTVAAIVSVLLVLFAPQYGIYHRDASGAWQGIFNHKNALGIGMAFLLTPVFFTKERLSSKIGYGALLLFLIGMSQSRGAWFETAGVLAFIAWLSIFRRLRSLESRLLTVATVTATIAIVVLGVLYLEPLMGFIGKDPTLTGRTGIYSAVLESIFKHPVLGYGFNAFWHGVNPESLIIALRIQWPTIGYAENGLLELWLDLGTVGLCLVLLPFGRGIRQSVRLIRSRYYSPRVGWFSVIIFLELITNIEGGVAMAPDHLEWTLTLIAFIGLANEMRGRDEQGSALQGYWSERVGG
jgi:exopolysaccharide production protein ExoQ